MCVCFLNFFIDGCWWKHHPRLAGASRWILEWGFRRIFLQLSCKGWKTLYFDAFQCSWLMAIVASQLIAGQDHARTHTTALHCTFGTTVRKYSTNLPSTSYDLISKMHDLHLLYLEALPCAQAPLNYAELARAFPITSRTTTKSSHVHPCTAPRTSCNEKWKSRASETASSKVLPNHPSSRGSDGIELLFWAFFRMNGLWRLRLVNVTETNTPLLNSSPTQLVF